ncbi:MAG TPA: hypothetical protein VFG72_12925 [Marmoricola sp.]|nr:hypothetical protein [Marmoricola sp.]
MTTDVASFLLNRSTPFTGAHARSTGCTRWQLERLVRAGLIRRVLSDVYVPADVPDSVELRASAAALVLAPHAVMVDRTAAWLWGVDTLDPHEVGTIPPLEVFVLRGRKRVRRREAAGGERDLCSEDIVEIKDVRVTVPLRTALDLACRLSRYEAMVALDAFARLHGLTPREMSLELERRYRRRRGVVQARELVPLVTPLAESAGESFTRVVIHDEGLPAPAPQRWVYDGGVPVFRLDLAYELLKVCVEYDGEEFHGEERKEHDRRRRIWLKKHGWWVIVVKKHSFKGAARDEWLAELRRALAERS